VALKRRIFYDGIRHGPFPGKLTKGQVAGCEAILDGWEARAPTNSPLPDDLRWLAYMLATAYHETAHTMQPIKE